jgi:acyl carrier protein
VGRSDDQVKVRGHRIELGEVEANLRGIPGVADAAALAQVDGEGENRLLAYVVAETGAGALLPGDIRSMLQLRLPEYMIPSGFFELRELPLTPNGKTDREALVRLADSDSPRLRAPYVAPGTDTEHLLSGIWAEVLGVDAVGVDDDFFDLGGHSLLAVQIVLRIAEATNKELTLLQLMENSTLGSLAAFVDALTPADQEGV